MLWVIVALEVFIIVLIIGFMLLFCLILWPFRMNQSTLKSFEVPESTS